MSSSTSPIRSIPVNNSSKGSRPKGSVGRSEVACVCLTAVGFPNVPSSPLPWLYRWCGQPQLPLRNLKWTRSGTSLQCGIRALRSARTLSSDHYQNWFCSAHTFPGICEARVVLARLRSRLGPLATGKEDVSLAPQTWRYKRSGLNRSHFCSWEDWGNME